jgi:hypothetical protein
VLGQIGARKAPAFRACGSSACESSSVVPILSPRSTLIALVSVVAVLIEIGAEITVSCGRLRGDASRLTTLKHSIYHDKRMILRDLAKSHVGDPDACAPVQNPEGAQ